MRNQSERPLSIDVPTADKDKPAWVKVGVIAAVGFVIGIAWPRVMGVRIGPNAPAETAAAAAASASAAHGGHAPDAPPASVSAKLAMPAPSGTVAVATPSSAAPAAGAAAPPAIAVAKGMVLTCVTADGEKKRGNKDCGAVPGVDEIVRPRIRKIANCSGVEGQTGKFTLTANADFVSGRFSYDVNKASASVQNLDAILACLKTSFHNTATTATPHEHNKYTVVYVAQLSAAESDKSVAKADKDKEPASSKAKETADEKPAPEKETPAAKAGIGEAEIAYDVAVIRDAPKTGNIVGRAPRGSKVKVGSSKDGWYQVKFGDGFANEGWLYRAAIGR